MSFTTHNLEKAREAALQLAWMRAHLRHMRPEKQEVFEECVSLFSKHVVALLEEGTRQEQNISRKLEGR